MSMLGSFPLCSIHLCTTSAAAAATTRLLGTHKGAAKLEAFTAKLEVIWRRREKDGEGQGGMKSKKKNKKVLQIVGADLISRATLNSTNTPAQELKDSDTLPQSQIGGGGREESGGELEGNNLAKSEVGTGGDRGREGKGERGELVGAIKPSPSPSSGLLSTVLDGLERAIVWAFCGSTREPLHFISSPNFGPTTETPPHTQLPISGHLPDCLNGEFALIGANPKHELVAGYHWFDGDGMIRALRIKDGNATYASRYVQTSKLLQEDFFGGAKFIKLGDSKGIFGILMALIMICRAKFKVLDTSEGSGTANTAITYHDGRILALHEGDKPYAIKILEDGDLETLGYLDFGKQLNHPFTAHPKVDPITGEMFMFGYQLEKLPYCLYHVISKDGEMQDAVTITIPGPIMMHDFAITENYAIFMDLPLCYSPEIMGKGNLIFRFDSSKKARFGILPRYAKDESQIKWFELPTCYIFHNANAWEEGDEVVLYSCMAPTANLEFFSTPFNKDVKSFKAELYELRFNLKTGNASTKQLSVSSVDFPRINDKYIGRKQRYVYGTIIENLKIKGIAKFDLNSSPNLDGKREIESGGNVAGVFSFGPGRYGSEAVFVPKSSGAYESEDNGYLLCFVYDENTRKSEALVIDAKTMAPEPVAVVSLPSRVPYGFHATFISEDQLCQQKKS